MRDGLNPKQETFCRLVATNMDPAEAYMEAYGIENKRAAYACASRLMKPEKNPLVDQRIKELKKLANAAAIKSAAKEISKDKVREILVAEDIAEFWSKVMRDESVDMKDRLKSSELLAKHRMMFVEQIKMDANIDQVEITVVE